LLASVSFLFHQPFRQTTHREAPTIKPIAAGPPKMLSQFFQLSGG
jgi:hypothetical protein